VRHSAWLVPLLLILPDAAVRGQEHGASLARPPAPWTSTPTPTRTVVSEPVFLGDADALAAPPRSRRTDANEERRATLRPSRQATLEDPVRVVLNSHGPVGREAKEIAEADLGLVAELSFSPRDADFVLYAEGEVRDGRADLSMQLRALGGGDGVLEWWFAGEPEEVSRFVHRFVDRAVEVLTGRGGGFASRIAFARRAGPGRKDVYLADYDGAHLRRMSSGRGIAVQPTIAGEHVWYSVVTEQGVFITRSGARDRPLIAGSGTTNGATHCGAKLFFTSTRDGNSELYELTPATSAMRRLTNHPSIDLSPSCAPGGIAFVSDRTGVPQVYTMDTRTGQTVQRTFDPQPSHTPTMCSDPQRPLIAYTQTGRGMKIMLLDVAAGSVVQVSPSGGWHKDPAFSPDCRVLAWASAAGVRVARLDGSHGRVVIPGAAESVRWSR